MPVRASWAQTPSKVSGGERNLARELATNRTAVVKPIEHLSTGKVSLETHFNGLLIGSGLRFPLALLVPLLPPAVASLRLHGRFKPVLAVGRRGADGRKRTG